MSYSTHQAKTSPLQTARVAQLRRVSAKASVQDREVLALVALLRRPLHHRRRQEIMGNGMVEARVNRLQARAARRRVPMQETANGILNATASQLVRKLSALPRCL
jgi:hypothetical protein